jgi:hypothetical protein
VSTTVTVHRSGQWTPQPRARDPRQATKKKNLYHMVSQVVD